MGSGTLRQNGKGQYRLRQRKQEEHQRISTCGIRDDNQGKLPEVMRLEAEFAKQHKHDTDQDLIEYIRATADRLGHIPKKHEVRGYALIKSRLGPWPRVLEAAGLKIKKHR